MEVIDPVASTLPPGPILMPPPPKSSPRKTAAPKRSKSAKEVRTKRVSPKSALSYGSEAYIAKPSPKPFRSTAQGGKPIVPSTERASHEERSLGKGSKDISEPEKWEVAPDGGSAGREGRQFTVANVGNNGRIYLRPAVRPAHQRYPQPDFVFPATPPDTAGLDSSKQPKHEVDNFRALSPGPWSPMLRGPSPQADRFFPESHSSMAPPRKHRRALSDSTIQEANAAKESEAGAFKIVISKPSQDHRPKTTEDAEAEALLDINIPSWRIGVPDFTNNGTPLFGRSSHTPTEEYHYSIRGSMIDHAQGDLNASIPRLSTRRPSILKVPKSRFSRHVPPRSPGLTSPGLTSSKSQHTLRTTFLSTRPVITPSMFDELTFKPACDDAAMVRYTTSTGLITAATPARLVAEITSPSFLDYELISDFFLTFRAFLEPSLLLEMLVARLRWAIGRPDETGMIVHVRSFVAMRHWILNYFMDDFLLDRDLRVQFCDSINEFILELKQHPDNHKAQLKIIFELTKCWRRVCAQYWDVQDVDDGPHGHASLVPGGIAGNRDPNKDSSSSQSSLTSPPVDMLSSVPEASATSFFANTSAGQLADPIVVGNHTPYLNDGHPTTDAPEFGPASPTSLASLDVVSCSFPGKNICPAILTDTPRPLGAHPVSSSLVFEQPGPIATTPRALIGKRVRPNQTHQRNDSLPESLGPNNADVVPLRAYDYESETHAGSLVRGNMLPPSQSFVDFSLPLQTRPGRRTTTVFQSQELANQALSPVADGMTGSGMKRLIGSVRRALSTRGGHGTHPIQNNRRRNSGGNLSVPSMNPAHGGGALLSVSSGGLDGNRPPVRIDLLGAEVAEDFKRAVSEDAAAAEADALSRYDGDSSKSAPTETLNPGYSSVRVDSATLEPPQRGLRAASDTGLTVGSKSILIVDDTVAGEVPVSRDGDATNHSSVNAFVETLMPRTGHLTPPTTPPARFEETARRSSHLLNDHVQNPSYRESLPPFVPDMDTLGNRSTASGSTGVHHRRMPSTQRNRQHPPVSGAMARLQMRSRSTRTQQSLDSVLHRKQMSISSDVAPPSTAVSLDPDTTCSEASMDLGESDADAPNPTRVLRRRPGGDLRAATNVSEIDTFALRRSRSLASLSAYTESARASRYQSMRRNSSDNIDSIINNDHRHSQAFSVGQLAEKPRRHELSLCSTGSSKPPMRPSFEAEAKKLARIPDDDDDGGVECALLKLEGKYHKREPESPLDAPIFEIFRHESNRDSFGATADDDAVHYLADEDPDQRSESDDMQSISSNDVERTPVAPNGGLYRRLEAPEVPRKALSFLSESSRDSYHSTPLLGRDPLGSELYRATRDWADKSILQDSDDEGAGGALVTTREITEDDTEEDQQYLPFDFTRDTESVGAAPLDEADAVSTRLEDRSFLDSDLSSEISNDEYFSSHAAAAGPDSTLPVHPLASPDPRLPKKPMLSMLDTSDTYSTTKRSDKNTSSVVQYYPPTPVGTPAGPAGPRSPYDLIGSSEPAFHSRANATEESRKFSVHLPFVLAFDSETLAQQFTLIEKDALNEIDWKELVDMDWKHATNHDSRSWVEFLRNNDAYGVEVVIARFNLVVKWAISEIVLTQHIEERARCIIKFIHTASHCRRYRNFATLAQLTIALSSNEVSRLARTWELVPAQDMKTLKDLETLVTPMRNFYNLRAEMESSPDTRCIPFVGIYTHDLLYNAQRPSEIASSPTGQPLVNFERCRIGASVVKTLLRLLEASTQYHFIPIEGITERCLWIGALSDEEIRRHSGNLE